MRHNPDPLAGPIACDGCHRTIWWPRWIPNGGGDYFSLCHLCYYQQDKQFTTETALAEALAIITARHQVCDSREMMACPPPFRVWYPLIGGVE